MTDNHEGSLQVQAHVQLRIDDPLPFVARRGGIGEDPPVRDGVGGRALEDGGDRVAGDGDEGAVRRNVPAACLRGEEGDKGV